ncbi:MAG: glucose 1-dehydrogenase [Myxococcota bacterium]|jgi:NAD(P)-dependent dehydrogenase (short-subunit alcohol dehydrogenase family)|nr:glucose 1-dehydrogenase [Myxococcota bacterium]
MSGRLEGQVALISGGASGIGEATTRTFLREGARVVIADIQDERGERIAKELGENAVYQHTNVAEEESVAAAVDRAVSHFGRLDCVFANAGIVGAVGPIDTTPIEEYDATMGINLRGVFLCMKHAARVMKPQKSGTILSTSSIAGLRGGLGPHVYAATKSALLGLTRNVAAELVSQGIRVNTIVPGNMATEMIAGLATGDPENVEVIEQGMASSSPIPGRAGKAQDIAEAALYLASAAGAFVNGHALVVDAGLTAGCDQSAPVFSEYSPMIREAGQRGIPD